MMKKEINKTCICNANNYNAKSLFLTIQQYTYVKQLVWSNLTHLLYVFVRRKRKLCDNT